MDERELREIKRIARRNSVTVAEWVRQALRVARREEPLAPSNRKLRAVRESVRHSYPTGDIDQMLGEVERGYLEGAE